MKPKIVLSLASFVIDVEPNSFPKASEHSNWVDAMSEEYRALIANNT